MNIALKKPNLADLVQVETTNEHDCYFTKTKYRLAVTLPNAPPLYTEYTEHQSDVLAQGRRKGAQADVGQTVLRDVVDRSVEQTLARALVIHERTSVPCGT